MNIQRSSLPMDLQQANEEFAKVKYSLENLLVKLGYDCENLKLDSRNEDESFLRDEYANIAEALEQVHNQIHYLTLAVTDAGHIHLNSAGRYELPSGNYLTSGDVCEILIVDKTTGEHSWLKTRIEYNGADYYSVDLGEDIPLSGRVIRIRT